MENGLTAREMVKGHNPHKRRAVYPDNPGGYLKMILDSRDPIMAAIMTFGRYTPKQDEDGTVHIQDFYNFNKPADFKRDDAYSVLRNLVLGGKEGFPANITLNQRR
jgi:hypothetical protein